MFCATLIHSFEDLKNFVKTIYPESENLDDIVRKKDKVLLRRYGRMLIDRDMKALKEGKFKIPFRFKETLNLDNDIVDIISSEYKANECAVGKPFANKFLLEEGDSLNDVSVTFFENMLQRRGISSIASATSVADRCMGRSLLPLSTVTEPTGSPKTSPETCQSTFAPLDFSTRKKPIRRSLKHTLLTISGIFFATASATRYAAEEMSDGRHTLKPP